MWFHEAVPFFQDLEDVLGLELVPQLSLDGGRLILDFGVVKRAVEVSVVEKALLLRLEFKGMTVLPDLVFDALDEFAGEEEAVAVIQGGTAAEISLDKEFRPDNSTTYSALVMGLKHVADSATVAKAVGNSIQIRTNGNRYLLAWIDEDNYVHFTPSMGKRSDGTSVGGPPLVVASLAMGFRESKASERQSADQSPPPMSPTEVSPSPPTQKTRSLLRPLEEVTYHPSQSFASSGTSFMHSQVSIPSITGIALPTGPRRPRVPSSIETEGVSKRTRRK